MTNGFPKGGGLCVGGLSRRSAIVRGGYDVGVAQALRRVISELKRRGFDLEVNDFASCFNF